MRAGYTSRSQPPDLGVDAGRAVRAADVLTTVSHGLGFQVHTRPRSTYLYSVGLGCRVAYLVRALRHGLGLRTECFECWG